MEYNNNQDHCVEYICLRVCYNYHMWCGVYRTCNAGQIRSDGNSDSFLMIFLLRDAGQHEPRHVGSGNPPGPAGDLIMISN